MTAPLSDPVLEGLTQEGLSRAICRIKTSSAFYRDQAKIWNRINSRYNRDLDHQTADALDAAVQILSRQIDALRAAGVIPKGGE